MIKRGSLGTNESLNNQEIEGGGKYTFSEIYSSIDSLLKTKWRIESIFSWRTEHYQFDNLINTKLIQKCKSLQALTPLKVNR